MLHETKVWFRASIFLKNMATSESCEDDAQENVSFLTPISAVSKPGMALLKSE